MPVAQWSTIPDEEKRQALELVLQSRTFLRCDQLKSILRFVCESEIQGRAADLSEYVIGVEALGRHTNYNPVEDSTVRTRAYELRQKLKKLYALEVPDAPVRIEIEKGAYVPRFVRAAIVPATPAAAEAPTAPSIVLEKPPNKSGYLKPLIIINCLLLAVSIYALVRLARPSRPAPQNARWSPALEAFWKPYLDEQTPVLLSYDARLFLFAQPLDLILRHWNTNEMKDIPSSEPLSRLQKQMGVKSFVESRNYTDFGTVNTVFLLTQTIGPRQPRISLKRSKDLGWDDISNNNLIFVGNADIHPGLRRVLEAGDFIEEVPAIRNKHPRPGELALYPVAQMGSNDTDKYALLSRFPGPQRGRYILILGAAHSELPWALSEYITNPISAKELVDHLRQPSGEIPEAFQVILRVTLQSQVPVRVTYATHHVISAPEFRENVDRK